MKNDKYDLAKEFPEYYKAKKEPSLITLKKAKYLALDGKGEPGGKEFEDKIGAMYNMAYGMKMPMKLLGKDYTISKLETLWMVGETREGKFVMFPQSEWRWKMLIRVPDFITEKIFIKYKEETALKSLNGYVKEIELAELNEGKCAQIMHVGPYDEVSPAIERLHEFIGANGLTFNGEHHEIYLSDPRRTAPEKIKTIIRQPVKEA